jgi:hypothetical protein
MAILGGGLVFAGLHLHSQSRDLVRLYGRPLLSKTGDSRLNTY